MMLLSEDQLKNLNKEALVIIVSSLQDQLNAVHTQLDNANAQLAENNKQIERLIEQIRIMNQRQHRQSSESNLLDGQLTLFDSFNEVEASAVPVAPPLAENGTFVTFPFFAGLVDHKTHSFFSFNSSTVISPILLTPFFLILLLFI